MSSRKVKTFVNPIEIKKAMLSRKISNLFTMHIPLRISCWKICKIMMKGRKGKSVKMTDTKVVLSRKKQQGLCSHALRHKCWFCVANVFGSTSSHANPHLASLNVATVVEVESN